MYKKTRMQLAVLCLHNSFSVLVKNLHVVIAVFGFNGQAFENTIDDGEENAEE